LLAAERGDQPEPRRLVLLEVDEQLGKPRGIILLVQPADQSCAVGVRPRQDAQQLGGALFADRLDYPIPKFA
jgi:hypothetical protein